VVAVATVAGLAAAGPRLLDGFQPDVTLSGTEGMKPPVGSPDGSAAPVQPTSSPAGTYEQPLWTAVDELTEAPEHSDGYDRGLFDHWIDADGDGCDTREEVLVKESTTPPEIAGDCSVTSGSWRFYYDSAAWTDPADVDIDHVVSLKEAWDSGAWAWNERTRQRFANDLRSPRSLAAVTDNVNQSKGESDFAEWQPQRRTCQYLRSWVVTKIRWRLTVDTVEKQAIAAAAQTCANELLHVVIAPTNGWSPRTGDELRPATIHSAG